MKSMSLARGSASAAAATAAKGPAPARMSDTLSRHLEELCRAGALERRKDGERHLHDYVDAEARDLPAEAFGRFMNDIYSRIQAMISKT